MKFINKDHNWVLNYFFSIITLIVLIFPLQIYSAFEYMGYNDGDIEYYNSRFGKIRVEYIINDSLLKQIVLLQQLKITSIYSYKDSTLYNISKTIKLFTFKELLLDKSHSIMFQFPLRDSMSWGQKGVSIRNMNEIKYTTRTTVKDTSILSNDKKVRCYKITSKTIFDDGEYSNNSYYFESATRRFIRVEMYIRAKGLIGKVLSLMKLNRFILYK